MDAPAKTNGMDRGEGPGLRREDTAAYQVLRKYNLLDSSYRLNGEHGEDIDGVPANSNPWSVLCCKLACCPCFLCGCFKSFTVPDGHITPVTDGRGGFHFHKAGVHLITDPFYRHSKPESFGANTIVHGDRSLLVVEQGMIGLVLNQGQPILLPPGMHQWKNPVLVYRESFDLNNNVIRMGPLTLVTVDEGYAAVTEDNGQQKILEGGQTYLLTHRNHKFQKYISCKIQSSNMQRIEATSADNVLMAVDATVIWRITDVDIAAKNSAETISASGGDIVTTTGDIGDISKLRNDVLKQAEASLAAFIGAVQYSDTFNIAALVQKDSPAVPVAEASVAPAGAAPKGAVTSSPLFDIERLQTCVDHANAVTATYGVSIISINIVAAVPSDKTLQSSLAQGAVAAAEAQKFETVARGRASAMLIEARGEAESLEIKARGEAEAEKIRADGARKAADLIESSATAVKLAVIDKTGAALDGKSSVFFGADAQNLDKLLAPAVVAAATK